MVVLPFSLSLPLYPLPLTPLHPFPSSKLSRRAPGMKVTVLEKGKGLGEGSSGYSSALLRCGYSLDPMMKTAIDGLVIHKNWKEYLEMEDAVAKYHNIPILWIVGKSR